MLETLGSTQQVLLRLLLENKAGMTVDGLAQALAITRNAVRQHLAGLERDTLVSQAGTRPTGGRPEQLYVLSEKGREAFPRQYSWFSTLLLESMREEAGEAGLAARLSAIGQRVAAQLQAQGGLPEAPEQRVARLAEVMLGLGYGATSKADADGTPGIEANNCVFHHLAARYPEVCQFDLALMADFVGTAVEHQECMARGGMVCRFKFPAKK